MYTALASGIKHAIAKKNKWDLGSISSTIPLVILLQAPLLSAQEPGAQLEEIKVTTTTKTQVDLRDTPASITVITREELAQRPTRDVMDAVRDSTGITLVGRGVGSRKVFSIRGMESHQSLVLIDGKRINATDNVLGHSDFQYNLIPLEAIERIEIVRGPLSSLYGSEALGGVINIITRAVPEKWRTNINLRTGFAESDLGGDEQQISFYSAGALTEKVGLSLSGSWTNLDKTAYANDPRISESEGKEVNSFYGRLSYQPISGHKIELDASQVQEDRDRDVFSTSRQPVLHESGYDLERSQISLSHQGEYGDISSSVKLYYAKFDHKNRTTNGVRPTLPQTLSDKILDGHISFPMGEQQLFTIGAEYRQEGLKHEGITTGESSITHKALFIQDEIDFSENLLLTVGGRLDHHELFGSEFSPRVYLVWHQSDKLTFKGGYSHGFKAPSIKQIDPNYQFTGPFTIFSNTDLNPEVTDNYEISANFNAEKYQLGLTLFYNDIDDLIDIQCIQNCRQLIGSSYIYRNINRARTKGIETALKFNLADNLSLDLNHTYLKADDRNTGLRLASRSEQTANAKLSWSQPAWGLNVNLRMEYIGNQVEYDRGNSIKLPSYHLWHIGLSKQLSSQITLKAGIENIADLHLEQESENFSHSERGRLFYLGLNIEF